MQKFQIISLIISAIVAICAIVNTYVGAIKKGKKKGKDAQGTINNDIKIKGDSSKITIDNSQYTKNEYKEIIHQERIQQVSQSDNGNTLLLIIAIMVGILIAFSTYYSYKNLVLVVLFTVSMLIFVATIVISKKCSHEIDRWMVLHMLITFATCFIPIVMSYEIQAPIGFEDYYMLLTQGDGTLNFRAIFQNNNKYFLYWTIQMSSFMLISVLIYENIRFNYQLIKEKAYDRGVIGRIILLICTFVIITGSLYKLLELIERLCTL